MSCPSEIEINKNLTFSICTHTPCSGVLTDADVPPIFRLYETETGVPILTGTLSKLDDASTTGFYVKTVAVTTANGFENGKNYTVYITATVGGDRGGIAYTFVAYNYRKAQVISASIITVSSPVAGDGIVTIFREDSYLSIDNRSLMWTIENYTGPDLTDCNAIFRIMQMHNYIDGVDNAEFETICGITQDGTTLTLEVELLQEETAEFAAVPPEDSPNYKCQIKAITGELSYITLVNAPLIVTKHIFGNLVGS